MSQEKVAALKEGFARFEREGTPAFEMFDPDVGLINFDSFPVTRQYHGWDGMVGWLVDVSEPFDEFRFELVDVLAHDDARRDDLSGRGCVEEGRTTFRAGLGRRLDVPGRQEREIPGPPYT